MLVLRHIWNDTETEEDLLRFLREPGLAAEAAARLYRLGYTPKCDEDGAYYWLTKKDRAWRECRRIGAPALRPLMKAIRIDPESSTAYSLMDTIREIIDDSGGDIPHAESEEVRHFAEEMRGHGARGIRARADLLLAALDSVGSLADTTDS